VSALFREPKICTLRVGAGCTTITSRGAGHLAACRRVSVYALVAGSAGLRAHTATNVAP
jgi:hypothetical protein